MSEKKDWKVLRLRLLRKINRLSISVGAKSLWTELAFNWCWNEPECCPHQMVVATALQVHKNTVLRWFKELADAGLLTKTKHYRGYRFNLATEIPANLLAEEWRFSNKLLTQRVRGTVITPVTQCVDDHQNGDRENTPEESRSLKSEKASHHISDRPPVSITNMVIENGSQSPNEGLYRSKYKKKKEEEEEEKLDASKSERPSETVANQEGRVESTSSQSREGRHPLVILSDPGKQRTYVSKETEPEDPSGLMEDHETQVRKNTRKKRGPDQVLVSLSGKGLMAASKPPQGTKVVQPEGPPPETPQDVLALLRGEIEAKYGKKFIRGIPRNLSGKEKTQISRGILAKFDPDVVISMVRVLVWDWEVARSSCFPYRPQVEIPTIEALVQYQETLASAVQTGLKYDGGIRGTWVTYASRYLKDAPGASSEDPF